MSEELKKFLGSNVRYDETGQMIFSNSEENGDQLILNVRGWGAIQNLFKDKDGKVNIEPSVKLQDELGEFIAKAIQEKIEASNE